MILNKKADDFNFSRLMGLLETSNDRMSREIKKLSSRPIQVDNKVYFPDNSMF